MPDLANEDGSLHIPAENEQQRAMRDHPDFEPYIAELWTGGPRPGATATAPHYPSSSNQGQPGPRQLATPTPRTGTLPTPVGGGYNVSRDDNRPPTADQWLPDSPQPTDYEQNALTGCYRRGTPAPPLPGDNVPAPRTFNAPDRLARTNDVEPRPSAAHQPSDRDQDPVTRGYRRTHQDPRYEQTRDNHQEGLDYELDTSTGFWRRKTTAAARPPNLPGPGESHWTPDLREPPNMYRDQREAMQRVYADRSRRRLGQDQLPSRDILAAEYETQLRYATAVQNIIDNDTRVIAKLEALIKEALAETVELERTLEHCRIDQRLSAKMVLDRHVFMFNDLLSALRLRRERRWT